MLLSAEKDSRIARNYKFPSTHLEVGRHTQIL